MKGGQIFNLAQTKAEDDIPLGKGLGGREVGGREIIRNRDELFNIARLKPKQRRAYCVG